MTPVALDQLLGYEEWERLRPILRPLFIADKETRRLAVGPHLTLLFESVQSVWYQVQEMVRVERITDPHLVQHELETYNELLPKPGELSATMFVEYADPAERDAALRKLVGLEQHLWLQLGEKRTPARFAEAQIGEKQVSAVQFVRFPVDVETAGRLVALAEEGRVRIVCDHPALPSEGVIRPVLARALARELEPEPQGAQG